MNKNSINPLLIASPVAYFANNLWLQQIAHHIVIGPGTILSGIAILLGLGGITIGSQSVRASFAIQATSLCDE